MRTRTVITLAFEHVIDHGADPVGKDNWNVPILNDMRLQADQVARITQHAGGAKVKLVDVTWEQL